MDPPTRSRVACRVLAAAHAGVALMVARARRVALPDQIIARQNGVHTSTPRLPPPGNIVCHFSDEHRFRLNETAVIACNITKERRNAARPSSARHARERRARPSRSGRTRSLQAPSLVPADLQCCDSLRHGQAVRVAGRGSRLWSASACGAHDGLDPSRSMPEGIEASRSEPRGLVLHASCTGRAHVPCRRKRRALQA